MTPICFLHARLVSHVEMPSSCNGASSSCCSSLSSSSSYICAFVCCRGALSSSRSHCCIIPSIVQRVIIGVQPSDCLCLQRHTCLPHLDPAQPSAPPTTSEYSSKFVPLHVDDLCITVSIRRLLNKQHTQQTKATTHTHTQSNSSNKQPDSLLLIHVSTATVASMTRYIDATELFTHLTHSLTHSQASQLTLGQWLWQTLHP